MSRLDGSVMREWAARVSRDGEPGPEPTRVIRPPDSGWIFGGRDLDMVLVSAGCCCWMCCGDDVVVACWLLMTLLLLLCGKDDSST
mmetsp:Transcript_6940/g.10834  ORF Transcript_6940/g.10834 Transcript_6940/m.10834 type:complete len:86 (-) Transcript_6940:7-264(-)